MAGVGVTRVTMARSHVSARRSCHPERYPAKDLRSSVAPLPRGDASRSTAQHDKLRWSVLLVFVVASATTASAAPKPVVADKYLDLTVTYAIHAKDIWHDSDVGGYWGDGLASQPDKNGNGHVRGMVNTMLGYAMLIHAMDEGWLDPKQASLLQQAGLSRAELLNYIQLNLKFLNAHHLSTPDAKTPNWGFSWQSPLWLGASGPACLLVWKDLPDDIKSDFKRIVATEADRIVNKPPKDYKPGDTGAEENAWDEHAPAIALAVDPTNAHAKDWMKALKTYAVNVYSVKADKGQEFVSTANLFDDFTLENHGFFHPDYVQVSGQHLGESLVFLQMGDKLNGTQFADEFKPYALHHLADCWEKVMKPLLLPDGEFAFPNGTDWTIHCSMEVSYLASISTLLNDPAALDAETKIISNSVRHREVSPEGRIFGDTNMEWWWEPLLIKRMSTAILQHEYRGSSGNIEAKTPGLASGATILPDAKVFLYRTPDYFASVAWGAKHMGTFYPLAQSDSITLPIEGILPKDLDTLIDHKRIDDAHVAILRLKTGKSLYCIFLPHSAVWISPVAFRGMAIENDKFTGGKRELFSENLDQQIPMLGNSKLNVTFNWANVDDKVGLMVSGSGFEYASPKDFNRKSAAFDTITPTNSAAWQMIGGITHEQTQRLHRGTTSIDAGQISLQAKDGPNGKTYKIEANPNGTEISIEPQ
jgi:hypothetical protein